MNIDLNNKRFSIYISMVGKTNGKLTLLKLLGEMPEYNGSKRRRMWGQVRCSCGKKFKVDMSKLRMGFPKACVKCGRKRIPPIEVGTVFDKLTVTQYINWNKIKCVCVCGRKVVLRLSQLRKNKTNSCGCFPNAQWEGVGKLSKTFYCRIKRNARNRGMRLLASIKQLWEKYENQKGRCALSGSPIYFNRDTAKASTASLDRIDSKKGYILDNLQWVHKDINLMKMDFSQRTFIKLCKKVAKHKR